jgi:hypothetical protein
MTETSTLQQDPVTLPDRPFGRVAVSVAGYALLLSLMLVSPLFVFVPAAIFHSAIRNGRAATIAATAIAAVAGWVVAMQTSPGTSHADLMMGYAYVIALIAAVALPSLIVQPRVQRREPFGRILMIAVVLAMLGLTATEAGMRAAMNFSPGREQVIRVNQMADQFVAAYQKSGAPADVISALRASTKLAVLCAPGFLLAEIAVVFVLSLVMFGRLRAWRQFVAQREAGLATAPMYLFRSLSLPEWLLFAFVFGGIAPLTSGMLQSISANVLAVTVFLYLLQGLAIFRALLIAVGAGPIGVIFAWGMVALMLPIAMVLLSIAGLFDSFFDFRKFKRKDHPDESHPH